MRRFVRSCLLPLLALSLPCAAPVSAHPAGDGAIRLQKGLNLDIWVDWLSVEDMLATEGFLSPYPDWRRHVSDERIAGLKADGFDFLRLPFDPAPLLALGPGAREPLVEDIRKTAELVLDAGLTVIVDLHSIPRPDEGWGTEEVVADLWTQYLELVTEVATALDGLPPDRVAFEPLNEPTKDCDAIAGNAAALWPAMLIDLHAAARAGAPDLSLVLSGACWGGVDGLEKVDPRVLNDTHVIWSFHSYSPFSFTHQGAGWVEGAERAVTGLPYPPSELDEEMGLRLAAEAAVREERSGRVADTAAIAEVIAGYRATPDDAVAGEVRRAAAWADRHGIARNRMLLGEFGALRSGPGGPYPRDWQARFLSDKRRAAEAEGIGWAVWNWAGDMGIDGSADGGGNAGTGTQGSGVVGTERQIAPTLCRALGLTCGSQ